MAVPVRPIFQNGQRLTAERLNTALDFLRTTVRRLSLGPLSAGVAAGLEVSPVFPATSDRFNVNPGVGIDGRGRLMVLEFAQTFTVPAIEAALGGAFRSGDVVEIRLVLDESSDAANECSPNQEIAVLENSVVQLLRSDSVTGGRLNCVSPWQDLDGAGTGQDCGITLGHVSRDNFGQLRVSREQRQGVSVQAGALRNSNGNQAMFLGESTTSDTSTAEVIRTSHPFITDGKLVANGASRFHNTATFDQLFGAEVQATLIGRQGTITGNQVAGMWPGDQRIFVVAGGGGATGGPTSVGPGQGGMSAVQCAVRTGFGGSINRPGVPLVADVDNGRPVVREFFQSSTPQSLVGISAAAGAFVNGVFSVPIATAGLIEVQVVSGVKINVGDPLTFDLTETTKLRPVAGDSKVPESSKVVLARAAQPTDGSFGNIAAWVIYPPQVPTATVVFNFTFPGFPVA